MEYKFWDDKKKKFVWLPTQEIPPGSILVSDKDGMPYFRLRTKDEMRI